MNRFKRVQKSTVSTVSQVVLLSDALEIVSQMLVKGKVKLTCRCGSSVSLNQLSSVVLLGSFMASHSFCGGMSAQWD